MVVASVLYPVSAGSFDIDYYLGTHGPMVDREFGPDMLGQEVLRGIPGPDGSAPQYHVHCLLRFADMDAAKRALGRAAATVMGDIKNFYPGQPQITFTEQAHGTEHAHGMGQAHV